MKIKIENNTAEFNLNFNLYDFPSILETAQEFTQTCWISINNLEETNSLNIRIEPKDNKESVEEAIGHFFNYILGIMNRKLKNSL